MVGPASPATEERSHSKMDVLATVAPQDGTAPTEHLVSTVQQGAQPTQIAHSA